MRIFKPVCGVLAVVFAAVCLSSCDQSLSASADDSEPSGSSPPQIDPPFSDPPPLQWVSCAAGGIECARLSVPLDYQQPLAQRLPLALARQRASVPEAERLGVLLINPGGPGVSGVDFVATELPLLMSEGGAVAAALARFDVIGFDPRGTGQSAAIRCALPGSDPLSRYPTTPTTLAEVANDLLAHANDCTQRYGEAYLQHFSTRNVVRDLEQLRQHLAQTQLNYLGYSYGTRIGSVYAQHHPDRLRTLVLDGAVHPTLSAAEIPWDLTAALQGNLAQIARLCALQLSDCQSPLADNLALAMRYLSQTRPESETRFLANGLIESVREVADYATIAQDLGQVIRSPGAVLLSITEALAEQPVSPATETSVTALRLLLCADDATRIGLASVEQRRERLLAVSSLFAPAMLDNMLLCHGWPVALEPLSAPMPPAGFSALVIGGVFDSQTPLAWSQALADLWQLPLLRSAHSGHGVALLGKSPCVDNLVTDYLLSAQLPSNLAACDAPPWSPADRSGAF